MNNTKAKIPALRDYQISTKYGFLMEDRVHELPETFKPWENIAKNLVLHLQNGTLRKEINKMPLLDFKELKENRDLRYAFICLSYMGNTYVWMNGEQGALQSIPQQLAIPWVGVADRLGLHPIMSHPCLLSNWKQVDQKVELSPENVDFSINFPGGPPQNWFWAVTLGVEMAAVPGLKAIVQALHAAEEDNVDVLQQEITCMTKALQDMKNSLMRMHERLTADAFYNGFRPYLSGWGGQGNALPDGLIYEGVSAEPKKFCGGSAAQSSALASFDIALGIEHKDDKKDFMLQMREYMMKPHRDFLYDLEKALSIRQYVVNKNNPALTAEYNSCVAAVKDFRSYHINIVTKYIVIPSTKKDSSNDFESLKTKGTGGTDLLPFLKALRTTTEERQFPILKEDKE